MAKKDRLRRRSRIYSRFNKGAETTLAIDRISAKKKNCRPALRRNLGTVDMHVAVDAELNYFCNFAII